MTGNKYPYHFATRQDARVTNLVSKEFHGAPWKSMVIQYSLELHGTPRYSMELHEVS